MRSCLAQLISVQMVERPGNGSGRSGVTAYELSERSIRVRFVNGSCYEYDALRPGMEHVRRMQTLALTGRGCGTYINQQVRGAYAREVHCI